MRRFLPVMLLLLAAVPARGHGLLIPADKELPPLALLSHQVTVTIQDQAATTAVEQVFRNHTDRELEATFLFPIPKGAAVQKLVLWVNGKETAGELVEAPKAAQIYTDIVRRTHDPALLEYLGNDLVRLRVFPIPRKGDQKVAIRFTALTQRENGLTEYVYPLKTDGKAARTLEKFSLTANLKSQHPIASIYSPTHAISVRRPNDREAVVNFERDQAILDKDFQLFYAVSDKDVGLTALTHRPSPGQDGFALLLLSPRAELPTDKMVSKDVVLVLDTSGSMRGPKMEQGKRALKYCLDHLGAKDRFAVLNFATTVNRYADKLQDVSKDQVERARKWVDDLEPTGGTAINDALAAALELRSADPGRVFTVVFVTDGQPTIGQTDPEKILKEVESKNTANTRVFTFGVGDDVNATLLDRIADRTRAVSTYVRPAEDLEAKAASLYGKISHPVLSDLKLTVSGGVTLSEVYPPQLPDLFHGGQVVVLARYRGQGHAAVRLTGQVGMEAKEFVYETNFPDKTAEDRSFVESLWARRKVGYLLDQIRANGEKKELVEEVTILAKRYGIATPYTSYLVVPDAPVPVAARFSGRPNVAFNAGGQQGGGFSGGGGGFGGGGFGGGMVGGGVPAGLAPATASGPQAKVSDFAKEAKSKPGELGGARGRFEEEQLRKGMDGKGKGDNGREYRRLAEALEKKEAYDRANLALGRRDKDAVQAGKLSVDLSVQTNNLRNQSQLEPTAQRNAAGRNCLELGGVWIDEGFDAKMVIVTVKAQSDAYFRILERHPEIKDVYRLGNHLVWVAPNGSALIIDTTDGKEKLSDAEIDKLFVSKKK